MKEHPAGIVLVIAGICGRMGRIIDRLASSTPGMQTFGVDLPAFVEAGQDRIRSADQLGKLLAHEPGIRKVALIMHNDPDAVVGQLARIVPGVPIIIGTTGLNREHDLAILEASRLTPVMKASNFSRGVAVLKRQAVLLAMALPPTFQI